jgi:hypothetical protein
MTHHFVSVCYFFLRFSFTIQTFLFNDDKQMSKIIKKDEKRQFHVIFLICLEGIREKFQFSSAQPWIYYSLSFKYLNKPFHTCFFPLWPLMHHARFEEKN